MLFCHRKCVLTLMLFDFELATTSRQTKARSGSKHIRTFIIFRLSHIIFGIRSSHIGLGRHSGRLSRGAPYSILLHTSETKIYTPHFFYSFLPLGEDVSPLLVAHLVEMSDQQWWYNMRPAPLRFVNLNGNIRLAPLRFVNLSNKVTSNK